MDLIDLGKTVARFAPFLGSVLPIPGGAALGQAIAASFGGDWKDPDDLARRIETDPEAAVKLRQIESNEFIEIQKLSVEAFKAETSDKDSARKKEIELKDPLPGQLAKGFIAGYVILAFAIVAALAAHALSKDELEPIIQIQKDMSYAVMLILAYYFGASYMNKINGNPK